jgi:pyruvate carboxylase subunit B
MPTRRYLVTVAGQKKTVELEENDGAVRAVIDGRERTVELRGKDGRYHWVEGSRVVTADVEAAGGKLTVAIDGEHLLVEVVEARLDAGSAAGREAPGGPAVLRAPIPGRVVQVLVELGATVKAGQGLLVVEAMKMENEIKAPRAGVVKEIRVVQGAAVEAGEELATIS